MMTLSACKFNETWADNRDELENMFDACSKMLNYKKEIGEVPCSFIVSESSSQIFWQGDNSVLYLQFVELIRFNSK